MRDSVQGLFRLIGAMTVALSSLSPAQAEPRTVNF